MWDVILALGSHLISSIGFEEEVTHTKRERERQIQANVHFQERFLREREREQEKTREKPLQKFSRTKKKRKKPRISCHFVGKVVSKFVPFLFFLVLKNLTRVSSLWFSLALKILSWKWTMIISLSFPHPFCVSNFLHKSNGWD